MPLRVGIPYQPYGFLIKKLDNLIIAQDDKGRIRYSGTDASTVIQSAIDALANRGRIFIKAEDYPIETMLSLKYDGITLEGEGRKTRLIGSSKNMDVIGFYGVRTGIVIRNLYVENNGIDPTNAAIDADNARRSIFENLYIKSNTYQGLTLHADTSDCFENIFNNIYFEGGTYQLYLLSDTYATENNLISDIHAFDGARGIQLDGTLNFRNLFTNIRISSTQSVGEVSPIGIYVEGEHHSFVNTVVKDSGGYGIYINGEHNSFVNVRVKNSSEHQINIVKSYNDIIGGSIFEGQKYGIKITGASENKIIALDIFNNGKSQANVYDGIAISGSSLRNQIRFNRIFDDQPTKTQKYALSEDTGVDYTQITDNDVTDWGLAASPFKKVGTNTIIRRNVGFVTESSGTATFSGDGATTSFSFAHGLASTPTVVKLEAKSADAAGDKYWTADATNITVTFLTAPPPGTNNVVISWNAEV